MALEWSQTKSVYTILPCSSPSLPLPSSVLIPFPSLSSHPFPTREPSLAPATGSGEHCKLPSGSAGSLAAKWFLLHFEFNCYYYYYYYYSQSHLSWHQCWSSFQATKWANSAIELSLSEDIDIELDTQASLSRAQSQSSSVTKCLDDILIQAAG